VAANSAKSFRRRRGYGAGAFYAGWTDTLPPHTYAYVQYDPVGNDYLILKGNCELGPRVKAVATPHMFNLDRLQWRRGPLHTSAILNSGGFTTWDAARRVLWGHSGDDGGGNAFIGYYPTVKRDNVRRWGLCINQVPVRVTQRCD
jgi:hypothetical protein